MDNSDIKSSFVTKSPVRLPSSSSLEVEANPLRCLRHAKIEEAIKLKLSSPFTSMTPDGTNASIHAYELSELTRYFDAFWHQTHEQFDKHNSST